MAPEIAKNHKHAHSFPSEWFSLGITMHELLTEHRPYEKNALARLPYEDEQTAERLKRDVSVCRLTHLKNVSDECKLLVQSMLIINPQYRITGKEIMKHPFFKNFKWDKLRNREYEVPYKPDVHKANCDGTFDVRAFFEKEEKKNPLPPNQNELFKGYEYNVYIKDDKKEKEDLSLNLSTTRLIDADAYITRREYKKKIYNSCKNQIVVPEIGRFLDKSKGENYPEVSKNVKKIIENINEEEITLSF